MAVAGSALVVHSSSIHLSIRGTGYFDPKKKQMHYETSQTGVDVP